MADVDWRGVDLARAVDEAFGDTELEWGEVRRLLADAGAPLGLEDLERVRDGLQRLDDHAGDSLPHCEDQQGYPSGSSP